MEDVYIYDAVRTPRGKGKQGGSLYEVRPVELLSGLLRSLKQRNMLETSMVGDVIAGCVTAVGEQGANIARIAALTAGWDMTVPGFTLNRFCASGLEAVNLGAMKIQTGQANLVVAGGVESMSRVKMGKDGGAWFLDPQINSALGFIPQGISADLLACLEGFSRNDLDHFACESQKKAFKARADGYFAKSIIPVKDQNGMMILDHDETIRETRMEELGRLEPAFKAAGELGFNDVAKGKYPQVGTIVNLHTAGNSSGIVDGAAVILLGRKDLADVLARKPRARLVSHAVVGTEPTIMLTGPGPASRLALTRAGMTPQDIDLFEINEAFSAVVLRAIRDLNIDEAKVNVNGGAIAMGHPLGATGAVILNILLDELERRDLNTGLATLCVGAGMGIATVIERV